MTESQIKLLKSNGFQATELEWQTLRQGFKGNGCGGGFFSFWLARFQMWWYHVSFENACLVHDASRIRPKNLRSDSHRIEADEFFYDNCIVELYNQKGKLTVSTLKLVDRFHAAVCLGSYTSYWIDN